MKTWLNPLILLSLLELQVVGVNGDHTFIPGLALLVLCVYQAFSDNAKSSVSGSGLNRNEKIIVIIYTLALVTGLLMPWPAGVRYGFLLSLTLIFLLAVFGARRGFGGRIAARYGLNKAALTDNGIHAASVLMIYIISFHIGAQIWFSLAFQPVIIVSCLIAYVLNKGKMRGLKINADFGPGTAGIHDKSLHALAKYWNAFMGVWCVMLMKDNGFFTEGQEHLILFAFMFLLFLVYVGKEHLFTVAEIVWLAFFVAFLTALDPLSEDLLRAHIPSFIQAFLVIVAFDLGGYYFQRHMDAPVSAPALPLLHGKRALVYLIAVIFIFGVSRMADDPGFDIENVLKNGGGSVYSSVLGGGDDGGANTAAQGVQPAAVGKISVDDRENSFHKTGT